MKYLLDQLSQSPNDIFDSFQGKKVLVIGDVMLDRYLRGVVERQSPEADVPVLDHRSTTTKLGGAANVALNYKSVGCEVHLLSIAGNDEGAREMESLLDEAKIENTILRLDDRPTTIKTRVIAENTHLLRVDFESKYDISVSSEEEVLTSFLNLLETFKPDITALQDYNKGLLTTDLIKAIIRDGAGKTFIAVDPKEKNFWAYKGAHLFKPNLREASVALEMMLKSRADWQSAIEILSHRLEAGAVALTLGDRGILLKKDDLSKYHPSSDVDVVDVCGAGDAVLVILSLMFKLDYALSDIAILSNWIGGKICEVSGVEIIHRDMVS